MVHDGSDPVKILVLARTSGHVESPLVLLDVHSMNHLKRQLEQTFKMFGGTSSPSLGNKTKCFGSEPIFDKCQTMKLTLSPISTSICSPLLAIFSGTKVSNCHPSARALNFSVCAGAWETSAIQSYHLNSGKIGFHRQDQSHTPTSWGKKPANPQELGYVVLPFMIFSAHTDWLIYPLLLVKTIVKVKTLKPHFC
jgi:hypothetical protein